MRMALLPLMVLAALVAATACGGDDGGGDVRPGDVTSDPADPGPAADTNDAEASPDTPTADTPPASDVAPESLDLGSCAWHGRVLDQDGAPLAKVSVVICGEDVSKCVKATTQADGTWKQGGTARADLGAKFLGGPTGHASVSLPLAPCAVADTDVGDVVLPTPDPGTAYDGVSGDWLQVHPHLALRLPPGVQTSMYETSFVQQAAEVEPTALHPWLTAQIAPVTAFALVPYDAESPEPVPFRATLPVASTTVDVYVLDYLTGAFVLLGDVAVDADGVATSTTATALPQLTWVAFVPR
jgi:hypothetical protein